MRYVIAGYGRVGQPAATQLQDSRHDVTVIDSDSRAVNEAQSQGLRVIEGDCDEEATLEAADLDSADGFAALTDSLEANVAACEAANAADCRTVLRVLSELDDETYEEYRRIADEIVYPERVGAAAAKTALLGGDFNVISSLTDDLCIARVSVPEDAPVLGERVVNVDLPGASRVYAHSRGNEDMSIPLPQTRFEPGDAIAVMAESELLQDVRVSIRGP
jgi:trk system potassium uptake protein TrkA